VPLLTLQSAKGYGFGNLSTSAATGDFWSIASYTISNSTTATFDFNNIPQTYKHLQIRLFGQGLTSDDSVIRFNNDSGTSYSWHELRGNRSNAGVSGTASLSNWSYIGRTPVASSGASYFGAVVCDIPDYTITNRNKLFYSIEGVDLGSGGVVGTMSGIWSSNNAVTRLQIELQGGYWSPYSHCGLYGIKGN
jgi:hypothetical protein